MNKKLRNGILGVEMVGLLAAGCVPLTHSPPGREIPHAHQDNYSPLDTGRYGILTTVTSTGNAARITPPTGSMGLTGNTPSPIDSGYRFDFVKPTWEK